MNNLTSKQLRFVSLSLSASLVLISTASFAGNVRMYQNAPSAQEMGDILFSSEQKKPEYRTRSISFAKKKPETYMQESTPKSMSATPSSTQEPVSDGPKTFGLAIKFASNSSTIMDESLPSLNEVGKMMAMDSSRKLLIEGHTDARGAEDYNFMLSYKRAKAVRDYLVQNFDLPVSSLKVNGKGESEPLAGTSPEDATNRRVQFYKAN